MVLSGPVKTCCGALLASAVFMVQACCLFLPLLGLALCTAGTLLVGIAAVLLGRRALLTVLISAALLSLFSPRLAIEFLLTSGLAGLSLGLFLARNPLIGILVAALSVFSGFLTVWLVFGVAAGFYPEWLPLSAGFSVIAVFSAAYSLLSGLLLKRITGGALFRRLVRAGID